MAAFLGNTLRGPLRGALRDEGISDDSLIRMRPLKLGLLRAVRVIASVAIVCAILGVEFHFHGLRNTTVTYSLLLAILFFAVRWDRLETLAASVVAAMGFLYYFQPPVRSFKAEDPQSYVAVA